MSHFSRCNQAEEARCVCLKQKAIRFIPQEWFSLCHILLKWAAQGPLARERSRRDLWVSTYESVSRRVKSQGEIPGARLTEPNTHLNRGKIYEQAQHSQIETPNYSRRAALCIAWSGGFFEIVGRVADVTVTKKKCFRLWGSRWIPATVQTSPQLIWKKKKTHTLKNQATNKYFGTNFFFLLCDLALAKLHKGIVHYFVKLAYCYNLPASQFI